ncbi:ISKra4 family transposase [Armatimonas sp.]|uniref:ISKra4 family transposase n=1 Tax=Armatimonas sp. TaxID=1872638 RepID=UPI00286A2D80|nr:ISKra4 family transposase [Armatimonas sp.]
MTEQTKQRLRERFEQILAAQYKKATTISDIEQIALDIGGQIKQAATEEVGQEAQEIDPQRESETTRGAESFQRATRVCCPGCQGNAWFKMQRVRSIQTLAGMLTLERAYYHCKKCQKGFCPLDTRLGLEQGSFYSPALAQEICALSASMPYELAMQTLARLTKVVVSGRSAQRLATGLVAQIVSDFVDQREEQMLPLAYLPEEKIPQELPEPEVLYLQADGIHTPMEDGSWKEMKVAVVRAEYFDGREMMPSHYISHLGEAATFGKHWEALALSCGSLKSKCLVVIGDGATWIWNLASTHFPRAVQILDFYHASEYVSAVARAVFGEQEAQKSAWLASRLHELKHSHWSSFWFALAELNQPTLESLVSLRTYFSHHASRMEYASYLKRGLCIGSGLAESSCKRIVSDRLKGSGMHWSVLGAEVIARLRGFFLGGEWDVFQAFWNARPRRGDTSPL